MPTNSDLNTRLIDLERLYIKQHQNKPTTLYLSPEDECELDKLGSILSSDKMKEIQEGRGREALPDIHGMKVVWDASETKVE
jgi:hypothetical protein